MHAHVIELSDLAAFVEIAIVDGGVTEKICKNSVELTGKPVFLRNFAEIFSSLGFIVTANEEKTKISVTMS